MRSILKNNNGQALVEYVMVLAVMVIIGAWGLSMLKCSLHGIWVSISCDILYPYPYSMVETENNYCQKIEDCFSI